MDEISTAPLNGHPMLFYRKQIIDGRDGLAVFTELPFNHSAPLGFVTSSDLGGTWYFQLPDSDEWQFKGADGKSFLCIQDAGNALWKASGKPASFAIEPFRRLPK